MPVEKNKNNRGLLTIILLTMLMIFAIILFDGVSNKKEARFSDLLMAIQQDRVTSISIKGQDIQYKIKGEETRPKYVVGPKESDVLLDIARERDVEINYEVASNGGFFQTVMPLLTFAMAGFLIFFVFRQLQGASGRAMSFGKSRAKMLEDGDTTVTFSDVAGLEEAKEEVEEIVDFLREPQKFTRLGGRIPKGVLLVGPPGTGKTLLARAIAGEAGVPFFSISGSDFVEMFVGVGASRVRDLFEQGKEKSPCIIFIDEIDAVGRQRGAGMGGGHDEREQTLNQLLVEMDGFETNETVILVAATNRPDVLDSALLRPGRFDRRVHIGNPDVKGRTAILEVHAKRTILSEDIDLRSIARGTPGFTGADLENLVNEAALLAARADKDFVDMSDFENAKDKVTMGLERKSLIIPPEERKRTAFHEAGHALVAQALPEADQVHKVSIVPRGRALGVTQLFPKEDQLGATTEQLNTKLVVYMGGRAAEEIIFSEITTGAQNDIQQATKIARAMVTEFGMSKAIGPMNLSGDGEVFVGRDYSKKSNTSDHLSQLVDSEIKRLLEEAYDQAKDILKNNLEILHSIAESLLEKETIGKDEFEELAQNVNWSNSPMVFA
jgi:cell division protease FtsH